MDPKTRSRFDEELPTVFKRVLARSVRYAKYPRVRAEIGSDDVGEAAKDLVQEAVLRTLAGERNWDPERVPDLGWFLVEVVRSIASSYLKRGEKRGPEFSDKIEPKPRGRLGLGANPRASPEEECSRKQSIARLEEGLLEAAGDDEVLLAVVQEIFDGAVKAGEIAESLDWPAEKVYAAFRKLRRRLDKMSFRGGDT